jgi:hypothetical protein
MGRSAILYTAGPMIFWASVITHTLLIPVSFWGVYRLGFHERAIIPVLIFAVVMLFASFFFTPYYLNVNCVFYHCDMTDPGDGYTIYFIWRSLIPWLITACISYTITAFVFYKRRIPWNSRANNT